MELEDINSEVMSEVLAALKDLIEITSTPSDKLAFL